MGFEVLQIFQRFRTFRDQGDTAVVEDDPFRQDILFGQGVDEGLEQVLAQLIVADAHDGCIDDDRVVRARRDRPFVFTDIGPFLDQADRVMRIRFLAHRIGAVHFLG